VKDGPHHRPDRPKEAAVPAERHETVRREIVELLSGRELSAQEISGAVRISIREALGHLEHIEKSLRKREARLIVVPSVCNKCGFVFAKRERLKKPGRCPVCRGETISEPRYAIGGNPQA
jgi:hypothetical protein